MIMPWTERCGKMGFTGRLPTSNHIQFGRIHPEQCELPVVKVQQIEADPSVAHRRNIQLPTVIKLQKGIVPLRPSFPPIADSYPDRYARLPKQDIQIQI